MKVHPAFSRHLKAKRFARVGRSFDWQPNLVPAYTMHPTLWKKCSHIRSRERRLLSPGAGNTQKKKGIPLPSFPRRRKHTAKKGIPEGLLLFASRLGRAPEVAVPNEDGHSQDASAGQADDETHTKKKISLRATDC